MVLSSENKYSRRPTRSNPEEGNSGTGRYREPCPAPAESKTHSMSITPQCREPGDLGPAREAERDGRGKPCAYKPVMHGAEKSHGVVVPRKGRNEVAGRRAWREGLHPRGVQRIGRLRNSESEEDVARSLKHTFADGSTASVRPEGGTVCGKSARTGLCGGHRETGVPTAIVPGRTTLCRSGITRLQVHSG